MVWRALILLWLVLAGSAGAVTNTFDLTVSIGGTAFAMPTSDVIHFMAATGCSDSNNGTSAATPWCTPNHTMNCGDVIIAAAGTYSNAQLGATWGTVNNCPSSSGGIDGAGGVWFAVLLCGGTDLSTASGCLVSTNGAGSPSSLAEFENGASNWAVEGFNFQGGGNTRTFSIRTVSSNCASGFTSHHIAAINNVISNSLQAFGNNDCGQFTGSSAATMDYVAAVGNIAQNSNQDSICLGAIDMVGLGQFNSTATTRAFIYNNYGMHNISPCSNSFDGETFYIDSPDVHLFNGIAIFSNNIGYDGTRQCIAMTFGNHSSTVIPGIKVYNNTCYDNNQATGSGPPTTEGDNGEINMNTGNDGAPWTVTVRNNISYVDYGTSPGGPNTHLYAFDLWNSISSITNGSTSGSAQNNVYLGVAGVCTGSVCDAGNNIQSDRSPPGLVGTNFFQNPSFTNTSDLMSNRIGVPACTGAVTTTACMGWNANSSTLTTPSVISDLAASCANCTGNGFQKPSTSCATVGTGVVADFPSWLKGIVYLHWTGSAVVQNHDLATTPCGF